MATYYRPCNEYLLLDWRLDGAMDHQTQYIIRTGCKLSARSAGGKVRLDSVNSWLNARSKPARIITLKITPHTIALRQVPAPYRPVWGFYPVRCYIAAAAPQRANAPIQHRPNTNSTARNPPPTPMDGMCRLTAYRHVSRLSYTQSDPAAQI
jgi:hypothetical protein